MRTFSFAAVLFLAVLALGLGLAPPVVAESAVSTSVVGPCVKMIITDLAAPGPVLVRNTPVGDVQLATSESPPSIVELAVVRRDGVGNTILNNLCASVGGGSRASPLMNVTATLANTASNTTAVRATERTGQNRPTIRADDMA